MNNPRPISLVVLCALVAGCGAQSSSKSSPVTTLLDRYASGLRLGVEIAEAKAKLPALRFPEEGPYVTASLPRPVDGFDRVRLIDDGRMFLESYSPDDDAEVVRIEVTSGDAAAPARARRRIAEAFGRQPRRACIGDAESVTRDNVDFWTDGDEAGVVLISPFRGSDTTRASRAYSRIVFYEGPWRPSDITPSYMGERPCE